MLFSDIFAAVAEKFCACWVGPIFGYLGARIGCLYEIGSERAKSRGGTVLFTNEGGDVKRMGACFLNEIIANEMMTTT